MTPDRTPARAPRSAAPTVTLPIDLGRVYSGVPREGIQLTAATHMTIYVVMDGWGGEDTVTTFDVDLDKTGIYPVTLRGGAA